MRDTQILRLDRIYRPLFNLRLAYLLLLSLSLRARQQYGPERGGNNSRRNDCSTFTIGRMIDELRVRAATAFAAVVRALANGSGNWW